MFYRRGEIWWTKFKHNGATVRLSTGCSDPKAAAVEARRLRVQHEQTNPHRGPGVTLDVLEQLHIDALKDKGRNKLRVDTVENLWRNLYRHLGGEAREATTLTAADMQSYEGARRRDGARGQTIRREVQALRKALRLAKRDELISRLPFEFDELEAIESDAPLSRQESKPRSDKEIKAVLLALSAKAKRAGHHKMLRFIELTGLRLEELRRYDASWLRPATRGSKAAALLCVPTLATKTGRVTQIGRTLPLTKEALEIATAWGAQFAGKKFNHALWIASARVGVSPPLTPRDLRATYITKLARIDPAAAQRLAGHKSLATTSKYVKLADEEAVRVGAAVLGGTGRGHTRQRKEKKASNSAARP